MADQRPNTDQIRELRMLLLFAESHVKDALNTLSKGLQTLAKWEDQAGEPSTFSTVDASRNAVSIQRVRGGRSKVHKIDVYPELRAFVEARILTKTYDQIVVDVAMNFPPERRVSRSSVGRWWSKQATSQQSKSQKTA